MIALRQTFNIARRNCAGVTLDKIADDLVDSWAFDYGGTERSASRVQNAK